MKSKIIVTAALLAGVCGLGSCTRAQQAAPLLQSEDEASFNGDPWVLMDEAEDRRTLDPMLIELADSEDSEVRKRVAKALGGIGGADAAKILEKLLVDSNEEVRDAACFSSGLLAEDASSTLMPIVMDRLSKENRVDGIEALLDAVGRLGAEKDARRVADFLSGSDFQLRAFAARTLGVMGNRGVAIEDGIVERIADLLDDKEEQVRFMAAFALYRISKPLPGPPKAGAKLKEAFEKDASFEVRAYALRALARRGGLDEASLKRALEDKDAEVGATAVSVIGFAQEQKKCSLASLAILDTAVRLERAPDLIDKEFAHTARAALEFAADCEKTDEIKEAAGRIAKKTEAEARLGLAAATKVFCLARLVSGASDLSLVSCDQTRPHFGKQMLIKALERRIAGGAPDSEQDFKTLVEMKADPDLRVAISALNAISEIELPQAAQAVLNSLEDDRSLLAAAALDAVASHPDAYREKNGEASFKAREGVLKKIEQSVERFLAFEHAWGPVISAVSALAALGDPAVEPILRRLAANSEPTIRRAVLAAYKGIRGIEPPAGLPKLAPSRPLSSQYLESWRNTKSRATINTTRGSIEIELFNGIAPATVGSFVELSNEGYFDDTEIHRVVPNFVVQAGDRTGTGLGDPGYALRCEASPTPYERGTVGMALSGKDTGGSQFFITLSRQPHLDGNYTVFGRVTSGMEVADLIEEGDMILGISVTTE